jgi:hypothetical protein
MLMPKSKISPSPGYIISWYFFVKAANTLGRPALEVDRPAAAAPVLVLVLV